MLSNVIRKEELDIDRRISVSFTGHRPEKLPWGWDESSPECVDFKARLANEIEKAYSEGARFFLSGMADGVDLYAAEAVLELAKTRPDMKLIAVFPYGFGDSVRKRNIAGRAFAVVSICEYYKRECFMERNAYLIRHSQTVICGYSGESAGGTAATMRMAQRLGRRLTVVYTKRGIDNAFTDC